MAGLAVAAAWARAARVVVGVVAPEVCTWMVPMGRMADRARVELEARAAHLMAGPVVRPGREQAAMARAGVLPVLAAAVVVLLCFRPVARVANMEAGAGALEPMLPTRGQVAPAVRA